MNLEYAKHVWIKHSKGEALTDQEVIDGAMVFKELVKDLKETFQWHSAGVEAEVFWAFLESEKEVRGIE